MAVDTKLIVEGLTVVSQAGEKVGTVKDVRTHDLLLDRPLKRDLYVPFSAIREVSGRTVVLGMSADAVDDQDWESPPLFGGPTTSDTAPPDEEQVVGIGDPAERGSWSPSADAYSLEPLDTTEGRQAIEGTDDGERPRPADIDPETAQRAPATTDHDRLRDLLG